MRSARRRSWWAGLLVAIYAWGCSPATFAQSSATSSKSSPVPPATLEREFFGALREGDTKVVLSYIPEHGVNVGPQAHRTTRNEIEQQFLSHRGLYCKLFDSSCMEAPINLENSVRPCSDRELLTHSEKVNTAASEVTRGGVRQAVLVARIKNDQCSNAGLIDFIFNEEADGWKLFSVP